MLQSIGSVGDAFNNAMAESFVDSFKTELTADRVWKTTTQLELVVVEYIGWFNEVRLHESLGDLAPAEFEALYAPQTKTRIPILLIVGNHQPDDLPLLPWSRGSGDQVAVLTRPFSLRMVDGYATREATRLARGTESAVLVGCWAPRRPLRWVGLELWHKARTTR